MEDLRSATPSLTRLYRAIASEDLKYEIENLLVSADPEAFRALHSPGGPILSLLTLTPQTIYPTDKGKLVVYDYTAKLLTGDETGLTSSVSLLNLATRQETLFPTAALRLGGAANNVTLPPTFPSGRYRVRLKFYRAGRLISASHFSDVSV